uniref:Estrogen receptor-like isoform X2 n=1 Tax=Saccoglossus kowalevskii TaxID=10224 RepID=A0ABM0MXT9_SACKO|nr:PREDICTED: estrogen receptor-like isoform X2 [Saccoglossus kowalevskii]
MNDFAPEGFTQSNNQMSGNNEVPTLIYKTQPSQKPVKIASLKHRLLERASIDDDLQPSEWTVTPPPQPSTSAQMPSVAPPPPPPTSLPLSEPSPFIAEYQPLSSTINSDTQMKNISTLFISDVRKPQMPCASKQEIDVFGSLPQGDRKQLVHMAPLVTAYQPMGEEYTQTISQAVMSKEIEVHTSREAMPANEIKREPTEGIHNMSTKPTSTVTNSTVSIASSSVNVSTNGKTGKTKEAFTRNCAVCDDLASGYHYGVWSCEGCKAFFKRSIQGSAEYVCPATNECTIDKHRRKSCQACRLRKCYTVGMMRGVRKDRKPGGRSKYKRPCEDNTYSENGIPNKRKTCNPILLALVGAENEQVHFTENVDHSEQNFLMKTLIQLADRQLLQVITWAKQIPGYTTLELDDQVRLLENSWLEILLISLCYKSMQYKGERIYFAQGLTIGREEYAASGFSDLCQHIAALANKFFALCITLEEFVCLKALVLVNSAMELQSQDQLAKLQDDLTDALTEAVEFSNPTEARRLPKLLMLLTHLRHLSCKGIAQLFEVKNSGNVPLYDLLLEMLDANTLISRQQKPVQDPVGEEQPMAQGPNQSGNCENL